MSAHRSLRVLFFSPVSYFKGGAERSLFDLVANAAVEPLLLAPGEGPLLEEGKRRGIATRTLEFGAISSVHRPFKLLSGLKVMADLWSRAGALRTICAADRIDVVHTNGLKAHMVAAVARLRGGAPSVAHVRDIADTRMEKIVWRLLSPFCSQVILVSRACWPAANLPSNVHVVHNGAKAMASAPRGPLAPGADINLGFIGRIHPSKGLHVLLAWLRAAIERGQRVRLIVRGAFSEDAPNYEAEIKEQVETLSLANAVTFEGFVSDPTKVYEGIDLVCVPSYVPDPFPRAVMEGMANGIPVLAYPSGGIPEMIRDGEDGFLIGTERQFLDAVETLSSSPEVYVGISAAAIRKIREELRVESLHEGVNKVYKRAVKAH